MREDERPLAHGLAAQVAENADPRCALAHVLGHLAERQLPERAQVVGSEEVREGRLDAVGLVDLAGPDPFLQPLRGQVDQHHLVGLVQDAVREGLANADARQLGHRVVQALEVLDVHGRDDVGPGFQDLVDVLVALRVSHARRVRVGQLVDEGQLRPAGDDGVEIHLGEHEVAVVAPQPGNLLDAVRERCRLWPVVRLEVADHDVTAVVLRLAALLEHAVRLAHPRGHAQQDPVVAAHSRAEDVVHDEIDDLDRDEREEHAAAAVDQEVAAQQARSPRSRGIGPRAAPAARGPG